jgi:hypothetical protein
MSHHHLQDCPLPSLVVAIPPTASTVVPSHLPSPPSSPSPLPSSSSLCCILVDCCVCCLLLSLSIVMLLPLLPHPPPLCQSHHRLVRQCPQLSFIPLWPPSSLAACDCCVCCSNHTMTPNNPFFPHAICHIPSLLLCCLLHGRLENIVMVIIIVVVNLSQGQCNGKGRCWSQLDLLMTTQNC